MIIKNKERKEYGFTLIELMVSIALFSVVIVIAMGSLMTVIDSSRKAKTIKTVVNNLHIAIEGMSREIRVGYDYTCGATNHGNIDSNGGTDCSDSDFGFHTKKQGGKALYRLNNGTIQRDLDESASGGRDDGGWLNITADGITINNLEFKVEGTDLGDNIQPRVMIRIGGTAVIEKFTTDFNIQTTISQRRLAP